MAILHRLQWIDAQVRAGNYPNATSLARRFEISTRQAQRDLEYFRDSLGAPLEYCAARRGYHYASEAFLLPGPYATGEEWGMLANLASYYWKAASRFGGHSSTYSRLASLLSRLVDSQCPAAPPSPVQCRMVTPYRAVLENQRPGVARFPPPDLRPYWRGETAGRATFEFLDPDEFIGRLLGSGEVWLVVWPRWLRQRLATRLEKWSVPTVQQPESAPALSRPGSGPPILAGADFARPCYVAPPLHERVR